MEKPRQVIMHNHYDNEGKVIRTDAWWEGGDEALIDDELMDNPNPQCFHREGDIITLGFNADQPLKIEVMGHDDYRRGWRVRKVDAQ